MIFNLVVMLHNTSAQHAHTVNVENCNQDVSQILIADSLTHICGMCHARIPVENDVAHTNKQE